MKKFAGFISSYFKNEIKWEYFILAVLFLAVCIVLQYNFKLSNVYVEHYRKGLSYYPRAFALYAIPFAGTLVLYSAFYKKWDIWQNRSFLFLIFFTLAVYTIRCGATFHTELVNAYVSPAYKSYWLKVSNQLVHAGALFLFPLIYWFTTERKKTNLYGWHYPNVSLKPYFIILLCLIPVVVIACFQKDFLHAYPRFANTLKPDTDYKLVLGGLFELSYGMDLAMNEFFFRGFIVLAFAKFLGKGIILPMVLFYVFIHFGKPLGETVSSFFGGLALGIIAYETKSIYGGIILHVGIAWMMEIGAGLGRLF